MFGLYRAIRPIAILCDCLQYGSKTCIDALYSFEESENGLKNMTDLSSQAKVVQNQMETKKGEWYRLSVIAKSEFDIDFAKPDTKLQLKLSKFLIKCFKSESNFSNRKIWAVFRDVFDVSRWNVDDETKIAKTATFVKKKAQFLTNLFAPKINGSSLDDECQTFVKTICEKYNLKNLFDNNKMDKTKYFNIGKEILHIEGYKDGKLTKIRQECPNMVKLIKCCWMIGYANRSSESFGRTLTLIL